MDRIQRLSKLYKVINFILFIAVLFGAVAYYLGDVIGIVFASIYMGLIATMFAFHFALKDQKRYLEGIDRRRGIGLSILFILLSLVTLGYGIHFIIINSGEVNDGLTYIFNGAGNVTFALTYFIMVLVLNNKYNYIENGQRVYAELVDVQKSVTTSYTSNGASQSTVYKATFRQLNGEREFTANFNFDPEPALKHDHIYNVEVYLHPTKQRKYYIEKRGIVRYKERKR